jgi:2-dehydropantoate 2-reductase
MENVLLGKLLLNLNNPINALSGLTLKEELSDWKYRLCLALAQKEALKMMKLNGIYADRVTLIPNFLIPWILKLTNCLFRIIAREMIEIDRFARSSMWEDLQSKKLTEIDFINGETLKLAQRVGKTAPINAKLCSLIRAAENGARKEYSGDKLMLD